MRTCEELGVCNCATIPGVPVAKGRARAFVRNGHVGHYTPDKTARDMNQVIDGRQWMRSQYDNAMTECKR